MRLLLGLLLSLAAAVGLTRLVQHDPGYALITYGDLTLETTLAVVAGAVVAAFVVTYLLVRALVYAYRTPRRVRQWRTRRAARPAREGLLHGLMLMAEGKWPQAERRLLDHAEASQTPLLNYLTAARAAQFQQAYDRRDRYLQLAGDSLPAARLAVALTRAELQYDHGQLEQALATLNALRTRVPHHPQVLKLLALTHERLGNWPAIGELVDVLRRRRALEPANLARLQRALHCRTIQGVTGAEELRQLWDSIPAASRGDLELRRTYVDALLANGDHGRAEKIIRETLERQWDDGLCEAFGRIEGGDNAARLKQAEAWLRTRPKDATLLLAAGRIALRSQLWGVARRFLEASVGARPSAPAYQELAALLEGLDEGTAAMDCYRAGLEQSTGNPGPRLRLRAAPLAELAAHHPHAPA